ncbi:MAG: SUMF1/EgtB/PvdO family nonheme iron enzyme, partial [Pirellulales bacterium]
MGTLMARTRIVGYVVSTVLIGAVVTGSGYAVSIETVLVSNPGNLNDASDGDRISEGVQHFGAVAYEYRIGKYEVSNSQYVELLNAKDPTGANTLALYSDLMSTHSIGGIIFNERGNIGSKYEVKPGRGNNPVVFVNWVDAIRFANWLHNGQGNGDTDNGAYTIVGGGGLPTNPDNIPRNANATWFLPSSPLKFSPSRLPYVHGI